MEKSEANSSENILCSYKLSKTTGVGGHKNGNKGQKSEALFKKIQCGVY